MKKTLPADCARWLENGGAYAVEQADAAVS
jgi:hypothetical protein